MIRGTIRPMHSCVCVRSGLISDPISSEIGRKAFLSAFRKKICYLEATKDTVGAAVLDSVK